jgi:hypothetical protein
VKLLTFYRWSALVLGSILGGFVWGATFIDCKGAQSPAADVEAGAPIAQGVCTLIENVIASTAPNVAPIVETICADTPEIATIVETILLLRKATDAATSTATCSVVPTTSVCATPLELHAGIVAVLHARQARLLLDAGGAR